jgi:predicted nucleotidyltransferase component of viral defense system
MSREQPRNLGASVNARLLAQARQTNEEFQLLLMRYGLERLLYRLSQSDYRDDFVMKGAMMFVVWAGEPYRATKDLDLLALQSASRDRFRDIFRHLCSTSVVEDGLVFEKDTVTAEDIREEQTYQGVRVKLMAKLGTAKIPLQVDIGFGDTITPTPSKAEFPVLLDFPAPRLAMYRRETTIAEKFEAMVHLGMLNSRMKDFYDIWVLSQQFDFDGGVLSGAIEATFRRRQTTLPSTVPLALTPEFSGSPVKQAQWGAFVRRSRLKLATEGFEKVVVAIGDFLEAPQIAASQGEKLRATWAKGGPWLRSREL